MLSGKVGRERNLGKLQEAKLIYISGDMEIPQGGKDKRWGGIWKKRERERESRKGRGRERRGREEKFSKAKRVVDEEERLKGWEFGGHEHDQKEKEGCADSCNVE